MYVGPLIYINLKEKLRRRKVARRFVAQPPLCPCREVAPVRMRSFELRSHLHTKGDMCSRHYYKGSLSAEHVERHTYILYINAQDISVEI